MDPKRDTIDRHKKCLSGSFSVKHLLYFDIV